MPHIIGRQLSDYIFVGELFFTPRARELDELRFLQDNAEILMTNAQIMPTMSDMPTIQNASLKQLEKMQQDCKKMLEMFD